MIPPETLNGYLDGGAHIVGRAESFLKTGDPVCRRKGSRGLIYRGGTGDMCPAYFHMAVLVPSTFYSGKANVIFKKKTK